MNTILKVLPISILIMLSALTACSTKNDNIDLNAHDKIKIRGDGHLHDSYLNKKWLSLNQFRCEETDLWGFKDENGNVVINPQFFGVCSFSDGLAFVITEARERGSGAFIDAEGNFIISFSTIIETRPFSEGFAAIIIREWDLSNEQPLAVGTPGPFIFINKQGEDVFGQEFGSVTGFRDGLARVTIANGNTIFINQLGENAFGLEFMSAQNFIDGYVRVRMLDESRVYMDRKGRITEKTW